MISFTRRTHHHHEQVELLEATQTGNPDVPTEVTTTFASFVPPKHDWFTVVPGTRATAEVAGRTHARGLVEVYVERQVRVGERFVWQGETYEVIQVGRWRQEYSGIAELTTQ